MSERCNKRLKKIEQTSVVARLMKRLDLKFVIWEMDAGLIINSAQKSKQDNIDRRKY